MLSRTKVQKQACLITTRNKVNLETGLLIRHSLSESINRNGKINLFITFRRQSTDYEHGLKTILRIRFLEKTYIM